MDNPTSSAGQVPDGAPADPPSLAALLQREHRLDNAEALAGFGSWDWNLTGGSSSWSDHLFVIYGRDKADGVPAFDAWNETIHPDDHDALGACIQRALAGETRYSIEFRIFARNTGDMRYIQSQGMSTADASGKVTGICGVDQDITAARLARLALQTSEERFRSLTALSSDWFWEQDADLCFTIMSGYPGADPHCSPEAHLGKRRWEMPHTDIEDAVWEQHRAQLARREVFHDFEITRREPDGQRAHYLTSGQPFYDWQGQFAGYRGVGREVTRERQAQAERATTVRRFQTVLSNLHGGILLVSEAGMVEYVNQRFCDLFGVALVPQALMGPHVTEVHGLIGHQYRDSHAALARIDALVRADQAVHEEEVPMSGTRIFLRDFTPIVLDGKSCGRLWVYSDITDRKKTETLLQTSLREKEALLKEVHHRVKNNLQVITSLLRLESGRSADRTTRGVLDDMQGRIRSMAVLHESLYQSGTYASVDLGIYLGQLAGQVFRAQGQELARVALRLDVASVQVGMDQATPCGLILNELVSNSVKHGFPLGRAGEVHVRLQSLPGSPQVCLEVHDNGCGLPDDFLHRRSQSLGLQLVEDLASQIDGSLNVGTGPGARLSVVFTPHVPPQAAAGAEGISDP